MPTNRRLCIVCKKPLPPMQMKYCGLECYKKVNPPEKVKRYMERIRNVEKNKAVRDAVRKGKKVIFDKDFFILEENI